jgi:hypothetical protein
VSLVPLGLCLHLLLPLLLSTLRAPLLCCPVPSMFVSPPATSSPPPPTTTTHPVSPPPRSPAASAAATCQAGSCTATCPPARRAAAAAAPRQPPRSASLRGSSWRCPLRLPPPTALWRTSRSATTASPRWVVVGEEAGVGGGGGGAVRGLEEGWWRCGRQASCSSCAGARGSAELLSPSSREAAECCEQI